MSVRHYTCVICGRVLEYSGRLPELYPFCSDRCKLIDLGRWFHERYALDVAQPVEPCSPAPDCGGPDDPPDG